MKRKLALALIVGAVLLAAFLARGRFRHAPATWNRIGPYGGGWVTGLAVNPLHPERLVVTTSRPNEESGSRIYWSENGGASWTEATLLEPPEKDNHTANPCVGVVGDPAQPDHLIAPETESTCWHSSDGGRTWAAVALPGRRNRLYGLRSPSAGPVAWIPGRPGVAAIIWSANSGGASALFRTEDAGATWKRQGDLPAALDSLVPVAGEDARLIGLNWERRQTAYTSRDGGVSWVCEGSRIDNEAGFAKALCGTEAASPLPKLQPEDHPEHFSESLFWPDGAGGAFAVYESFMRSSEAKDQGKSLADPVSVLYHWPAQGRTWKRLGRIPPRHRGGGLPVWASVAGGPRATMYVAAGDRGLFASDDDGETWRPCTKGIAELRVDALDGAGGRVAAATPQGVFETTDDGATWHRVGGDATGPFDERPNPPAASAVALLPQAGAVLAVGQDGLWKYDPKDGGWARIDSRKGPPPPEPVRPSEHEARSLPPGATRSERVEGSQAGYVAWTVAGGPEQNGSMALHVSLDGGQHWALVYTREDGGRMEGCSAFLVQDPHEPARLGLCVSSSIVQWEGTTGHPLGGSEVWAVSRDKGATWHAVTLKEQVTDLAISPGGGPDIAYAFVSGSLCRIEHVWDEWVCTDLCAPSGWTHGRDRLQIEGAGEDLKVRFGMGPLDGLEWTRDVLRTDGALLSECGFASFAFGAVALYVVLGPSGSLRQDGHELLVLRSADGGASWAPIQAGTGFVFELCVDPAHPARAWAASHDGLSVSEDDGATWKDVAGTPGVCREMRLGASGAGLYVRLDVLSVGEHLGWEALRSWEPRHAVETRPHTDGYAICTIGDKAILSEWHTYDPSNGWRLLRDPEDSVARLFACDRTSTDHRIIHGVRDEWLWSEDGGNRSVPIDMPESQAFGELPGRILPLPGEVWLSTSRGVLRRTR